MTNKAVTVYNIFLLYYFFQTIEQVAIVWYREWQNFVCYKYLNWLRKFRNRMKALWLQVISTRKKEN